MTYSQHPLNSFKLSRKSTYYLPLLRQIPTYSKYVMLFSVIWVFPLPILL